jgi:hypothetical protein
MEVTGTSFTRPAKSSKRGKSLNETGRIQSEANAAMKLKALLLFVLAALLPLSAPRSARAADVSFDFFYEALLPHGEWIEVADYGFCWRPTEVDRDWTPYSDGYWTFTDAGWTWVGYEEFAGIVYHYGRWMNLESEGWCWVPDYEWGPAWVSWRKSDDYVGWAPLPPRAYWRPEIGISTWVDTAYDIGPAFYSFCRVRDFGAPVLRPVIINRSRNLVIIRGTVNITNITYNMHGTVPVIFNGGPSYTVISQRCERPIPALKLVIRTQFDRADFRGGAGRFSANARTVGNQLLVNAPLVAGPAQREFLREKAKKKVAADKVLSGWAGVQDGKERAELRQRFQRETKGITPYTAPARAVLAADLKAVPLEGEASAVQPGFGGKGTRGSVLPTPPTAQPVLAGPAEPRLTEPRGVERAEREKGRGKKDGATPPAVVSGGPSKPARPQVADNPPVVDPARGGDPQTVGKSQPDRKRREQETLPRPAVIVPPVAPVIGGVPVDPAQNPKPVVPAGVLPPGERKPAIPLADPAAGQAQVEGGRQKREAERQRADQADAEKARDEQKRLGQQRDAEALAAAAREKQAAEQATAAARERADLEKQSKDLEQRRAAQAAADKVRAEQELAKRKLNVETEAAAQRQKQETEAAALAAGKQKEEARELQQTAQMERARQEAERLRLAREQEAAAAAALEKQREDQRQAEAGKQAEMKRQQAEAQAQERLKQQQEQIAEQRRLMQVEQQKAAQEAAKQQAAARAREQQAERQAEQQRAAQEAAKQQAAEQRLQLQIEQQRAAQEAAKQQATEQRRALEAERQQAARQQQIEQQRAAQEATREQAAEQAREQQMEQQRAAREAARQQAAAEQRRQQQIEQQKAAQENARQQAGQQNRAMEAQREQAARQQAEAQRAAQQ